MPRMIDANAFKKENERLLHCDFPFLSEMTLEELIDEAPTIDAVPVIRCYECKYFKEFEKGFSSDWDGSCRYWNTHSTVYSNFCGCGARMDEE